MGRAIIKNIDNMGGGVPVPSPTGGTTGADIMTGILTDVQTGQDCRFEQPLGSEEGLTVGLKVAYQTVNVGGAIVANSVRLVEKGVIQSVNATDDSGMMLDKASGKAIPFRQNYCKANGLVAGSIVDFEEVEDPAAGPTAVALVLLK